VVCKVTQPELQTVRDTRRPRSDEMREVPCPESVAVSLRYISDTCRHANPRRRL
jgi:hypothetical protein